MPRYSIQIKKEKSHLDAIGVIHCTGRIVYEGWANGFWHAWEDLKKTVVPQDKWAGLPVTIEHEGGVLDSLEEVNKYQVGVIIKAFANEISKEILCSLVIYNKEAQELIFSGKSKLSIGFYANNILTGLKNITPNHLSLVSDPAFENAYLLKKQKNKRSKKMSEEELKALALSTAEIENKIQSLDETDYQKFLSLLEEARRGEENTAENQIQELRNKVDQLSSELKEKESQLLSSQKELARLNSNLNKANAKNYANQEKEKKKFTFNFKRKGD